MYSLGEGRGEFHTKVATLSAKRTLRKNTYTPTSLASRRGSHLTLLILGHLGIHIPKKGGGYYAPCLTFTGEIRINWVIVTKGVPFVPPKLSIDADFLQKLSEKPNY